MKTETELVITVFSGSKYLSTYAMILENLGECKTSKIQRASRMLEGNARNFHNEADLNFQMELRVVEGSTTLNSIQLPF